MIFKRTLKTRTFGILFLTVSFSISLLFYGRTLILDLKDLNKSEIALFTESQIMDQYFSDFQRALGFGGYIHNVKEYLIHRKPSQLTLMRLNIEELESSYASLREFFHDEESIQALQTIDNFLRVARESYEVILLPENQLLESAALDSLLMLETPETLSALITLETFKENYNRRAIRDIQSSIDDIVSDLLLASILLPMVLLIGIYLTYLLKRSYKNSLILKKNKKVIEAKSKGWETQLGKSEKQRIANLVILGDLNETTKTLRFEIEERKQAEQKIIEALESLSNAEVIAKMGNWSWNPNTNEVLWSDNMCRLYGIEPSEFDPTFDYANRYTHPDDLDYVSKIIERLLIEKKPQPSAEYRILTPDNKTVWVEGTTQLLFNEKGEIIEVVGTTQDITERKQIQETIMAKNKEMENYLYITSHDLRTPLVNIQGFSQRLEKQADSIKTLVADEKLEPEILHQLANITDENIPKTLNFIHTNIEKMDTLINGLLQLSRTGRLKMNIQEIDMNKLFAKIFQSLDFQIKDARCEIHINTLPECYGDAKLLDQLFANIISNALKYSDADRTLEITVDAKKTYNRVVYTIKDTGKGIAQKHLEKIWDVFYRVDPRSGKTGEGIGLSLVKRITEKHIGKIWVESEENKGSTFYIELQNREFTEI